jgi:enamine deaminase RidA (YjgF/YER057c/UK114 family)
LPAPPEPAGLYESAVAHAGVVYTAGMTARDNGGMVHPGLVGADVTVEEAVRAARIAAWRALSAAAQAVGGAERITRLLRLVVYVASADDCTEQTVVGDGASAALLEALGERARVARTACGVKALPGGACVEVELTAAYEAGEGR